MECSKCEELGLMYCVRSSDELQSPEAQAHLSASEACRKEVEANARMRQSFCAPDLLGALPSAKVDAEIIRVCSDGRKRVAATGVFPVFLRKAIIPVTLFVIGFISVGYIMLNMENAHQIKSASAALQVTAPLAAAPHQALTTQTAAANDSLKDSLKAGFAKNRGNLENSGVITVDLEKK